MADKPKYYWDACAWIALIQQDAGRFESLEYVIERAKKGEVEIWTSNFTLAEVYKRPTGDGDQMMLLPENDKAFEDYILQDFVERVQVDFDVGRHARILLRKYPTIRKPQDGIHLASALLYNVDELHTYDRKDLLDLSEQLDRKDGRKLKICNPPKPPAPQPAEHLPLFRDVDDGQGQNKAAKG